MTNDLLFRQQARQLNDHATELYCLQAYIVGHDGHDWTYRWSWDLSTLFTTQHEAETQRAEFYAEDRTRIVKMTLAEVEVLSVSEAEEVAVAVKPGNLF